MSGRHPHWDDELTERVRTAVSQCRDVDGGPIDDHDLFDVIATVEDWQEQRYWNYWVSKARRAHRAVAAIERVLELCSPNRPIPAVHGDWMAGYSAALGDVRNALGKLK